MHEIMDNEILIHELRNFLDSRGCLTKYPAKFRLKILSLYYLSEKLERGVRYTERELNEVIMRWHTFEDWALLRRDMFDRGFLERERNGATYRLADTQPALSKFGLQ